MTDKFPFTQDGGTIFPPPNNPKEGGARADFRADIPFDNQVEWHGVRWGWSRMTICPCKGLNNQTAQVDPNCTLCNGLGWAPFQTPGYFIDPAKVGKLNEEQTRLITKNKCMVIRGIATSMTSQPNMFAALGNWGLGSVMVTVRSENKLGYYDRLIYLDDVMPFSEVVDVGVSDAIKTRYPVAAFNGVLSETQQYGNGDLVLDAGVASWAAGKRPASGTRVSLNYMYHPVFVVIEYAHYIRAVPYRAKLPRKQQLTPMGETMYLPLQVVARLEHLPMEPG